MSLAGGAEQQSGKPPRQGESEGRASAEGSHICLVPDEYGAKAAGFADSSVSPAAFGNAEP